MIPCREQPIAYGVKLTFEDGTVVNWYRDSRRKTVHAEKNPHGYGFPRAAAKLEDIQKAMRPTTGEPARLVDERGIPMGAFDGGASPNPGPGGWGVVLPDGREICGGEAHTTNNRMELTGAIRLLEETTGALHAIGDSHYVIEGIRSWVSAWRVRGWTTVAGQPVSNRDLWERLDGLARGRKIVWERVGGHRGHPLNERCDWLSNRGRVGAGSKSETK
ncbi:MAG: ribonuclease H [Candidatus Eisenbacteria bacterium]